MSVVNSAQFIAANSDHVKVNEAGCKQASEVIYKSLQEKPYSTESWSDHPLNPIEKNLSTVDWIFTIDLLNFSFWSDADGLDTGDAKSQRFAVQYKGQLYTGYWSLVAAVNKALDQGIPFTKPQFWNEELTLETLEEIFQSATTEPIPLLKERFQVLKEAGAVFQTLGITSFADMVTASEKSALRLVETVRKNFSSFNDIAEYKNQTVYILKRAQILVSDIWACFNGVSYGEFTDIDFITMFADYRVPQILHYLGCLHYSDSLVNDLSGHVLIPNGDNREVELRGCSIWAVERIKYYLIETHPEIRGKINSVLLDFYLWDSAKDLQKSEGRAVGLPTHRTRSAYY
jgi:Potential Queuosine, Q, salvage protein family